MSTLRERVDALLLDLEDKAYTKVDEVARVLDDAAESFFNVLDDVTARVEDFKEQADQKAASKGSPLADFWKGFTDAVAEQTAPVATENTAVQRAKEAYEYLVDNDPVYNSHKGKDYWETYYKDWPSMHEEFIERAAKHQRENAYKPASRSETFDFFNL